MRELKIGRIYRRCDGLYFIVNSLAVSDSGSRVVTFTSLKEGTTYCSTYDDFMREVSTNEDNPTGQKYYYELVTDFDNQLNLISTGNLVNELLNRSDSPFFGLDVEALKNRVVLEDYVLAVVRDIEPEFAEPGIVRSVDIVSPHFTLESAKKASCRNSNPYVKILKRVFVDVGFDNKNDECYT